MTRQPQVVKVEFNIITENPLEPADLARVRVITVLGIMRETMREAGMDKQTAMLTALAYLEDCWQDGDKHVQVIKDTYNETTHATTH